MFTVIINNYNLFTWPKAMINCIEQMHGVEKIIIVDNKSTYHKTLDWYSSLKHEIIFTKNIGHTAPWSEIVKKRISTEYYVVTDPDLDISSLPKNTLYHLASILSYRPYLNKVGLGLYPPELKYKDLISQSFENEVFFNSLPVVSNLYREANVDTTFAMYNKNILNDYRVCGVRTIEPYYAFHLPWLLNEVMKIRDEYKYYLAHSNSSSSIAKIMKNLIK